MPDGSYSEPTYRNITLRVDDLQLSLRVDRTEEAEEAMRNAAKRVNNLFGRYQHTYPEASKREVLIYVSLHLAELLEHGLLQREQAQVEERLGAILAELETLEE